MSTHEMLQRARVWAEDAQQRLGVGASPETAFLLQRVSALAADIEALEAVVGKAYTIYQNDGRAFRNPIATLDEIAAVLQRLQEGPPA